MPTQPPPGATPVDRILSFLEMHKRPILQYAYPPGQDWSDHETFVQVELATADVITVLQEHQQMLLLLHQVKGYLSEEQAARVLKDFHQLLDKTQH